MSPSPIFLLKLAIYAVATAIAGGGALVRVYQTLGYKSWPITTGTVENHFTVAEGNKIVSYVAYSYSVSGEYYSGQISTGAFEEFPIGAPVDVYYKMDDPSISVGKKSAALTAIA
jgi:hypothetical protein